MESEWMERNPVRLRRSEICVEGRTTVGGVEDSVLGKQIMDLLSILDEIGESIQNSFGDNGLDYLDHLEQKVEKASSMTKDFGETVLELSGAFDRVKHSNIAISKETISRLKEDHKSLQRETEELQRSVSLVEQELMDQDEGMTQKKEEVERMEKQIEEERKEVKKVEEEREEAERELRKMKNWVDEIRRGLERLERQGERIEEEEKKANEEDEKDKEILKELEEKVKRRNCEMNKREIDLRRLNDVVRVAEEEVGGMRRLVDGRRRMEEEVVVSLGKMGEMKGRVECRLKEEAMKVRMGKMFEVERHFLEEEGRRLKEEEFGFLGEVWKRMKKGLEDGEKKVLEEERDLDELEKERRVLGDEMKKWFRRESNSRYVRVEHVS